MKYFILFCLLFLGRVNMAAAQYYFKHFKVEDGLSNNIVFCSVQDKKGFMWFGTRDGLNRFDGYTFKTFRHEAGNDHSLGSNYIICTYVDSMGILWIGTTNGLYQYNEKTEDFTLLNVTANANIGDIKRDNKDNLWFISGLALFKYDLKIKRLHSYQPAGQFDATSICIADNNIWVATGDGMVKKYIDKTDSFISFDLFENSSPVSSRWIKKIFNTGKNSLMVGTSNYGIKLFDLEKQTYKDILTYNDDKTEIYARDFIDNGDNEYWIATETGIYIYNLNSAGIKHVQKQYTDPYSISDNAIYTLCKDKEGSIWAGTYFGGVNYVPKAYAHFEKFYPLGTGAGISGNAIREICADQYNNLWIGTEDAGLNKLALGTGKFTNFRPTGIKGSISHSNIHGLLANGNELWIGTFEHGLDILNIKTGKVLKHLTLSNGSNTSRSNFIISLYKTSLGDILAGTGYGLYKYNPVKSTLDEVPEVIQNNFIYSITEDHEGTIWVGTLGSGVFYYNPKTHTKGNFRYEEANKGSLSNNTVNSIFEDSRRNLWFATEGGGICMLDKKRNAFKRYGTQNGFPSNIIFKVLEDKRQRLWISSSRGLICFNPLNNDLKIYTRANGLLTDQFNYNSAYKDLQGRMYFGSVNGMVSFNSDKFINNVFTPPVYITGFQVYNRELVINAKNSPLKTSVTITDGITLAYNQGTFSIDFAALSYTAPEMNEYAYKMDGLEHTWNYLKTNRKVYFTNLPAGTYTFWVKGSNSSGIWNRHPTRLVIEITPPFWASKWAYIAYAVIVISLLYYLIYSYHRRTEQKNRRKIEGLQLEKEREIAHLENEKEREIYLAKIAFFTNVTHEIRTPLTLIKGPLEKVMKSMGHNTGIADHLNIMEKNTHHLLDLTNQLLDFRKTETAGFSLSFIRTNISEILRDTYFRFKSAAEEKELEYLLKLPEGDVYAYVDMAAVIKILSNLFNNAIKYSLARVSIELFPRKNDDFVFKLRVTNDGTLVPQKFREKIFEPFVRLEGSESQLGTGIGLPLSRSLAELHKGTLDFEPGYEVNTFMLTLPVHQEKEFKLGAEVPGQPSIITVATQPVEDTNGLRILLVEDHADIREFIAKELTPAYTVIKTENGADALNALANGKISLIISDVMMPVMDGFELCRNVKSNIEFSHIPIILLTAKNTLESKIIGLELGADCYIEKPFSPEHLAVQVSSLLKNRNNVKEHFARHPLTSIKTMAYTRADEIFLEKVNDAIIKNMANTELSIEILAATVNMSRPTLFRKIKAISNLSPNELIKIARLKRAAELMAENDYKVYEICEIVGYSSQSYFAKNFQSQFGMTPSEYNNMKLAERQRVR